MRIAGIVATVAALAAGAAGCTGAGKVASPEGFPGDFPVPPGAVLRTAQDLGERGLNLVYTVEGDADRVAAGQRARMESAGWRLVAEVAVERGRVGSWRKEGRSAAVAVAADPAGTLLSVGYLAAPTVAGGGP